MARFSSFSSLNSELAEEIFSRTPAEDLIRSKAVCKEWYDLINPLTTGTNEKIIFKHLGFSSSKRFLRTVGNVVRIIDPLTKRCSASPILDEFKEPNDEVDTLLHCDGLILCKRRDDLWEFKEPRRPQIAMWNPLLRRAKWIVPSQFPSYASVYGIGYKTREEEGYKILRFSNSWFKHLEGDRKVEVYEFKNSSWRTLGDDVKVDVRVDIKGVAVMGNMYWLANNNRILGFDFTSERFKDVCSCPPPPLYFGHPCYLSCFREEARLSLLQQAGESKKIKVWRSNNLADEIVSFTPSFTVDTPNLPALRGSSPHPVYCFVKATSIYALCEGTEGYGVTFTTYGILREIDEGGQRKQTETETETERIYGRVRFPVFCGHVYVPSLVPLP